MHCKMMNDRIYVAYHYIYAEKLLYQGTDNYNSHSPLRVIIEFMNYELK